jgi:hypothetical protein
MTIQTHPAFTALVSAEQARRKLVRRPGGRAALAANSTLCFRLEQQIMRDTGATFSELTSAVLGAA